MTKLPDELITSSTPSSASLIAFSKLLAAIMLARSLRQPLLRCHALSSPRLYHQRIVDHYEAPKNVGSMDKSDPQVGTGLVGAPACGDVMKLQLRVGEDGRVEKAVFKVRHSSLQNPRSY